MIPLAPTIEGLFLSECSTSVLVHGLIIGAQVDVMAGKQGAKPSVIAHAPSVNWIDATLSFPPGTLSAGGFVSARQSLDGTTWSDPVPTEFGVPVIATPTDPDHVGKLNFWYPFYVGCECVFLTDAFPGAKPVTITVPGLDKSLRGSGEAITTSTKVDVDPFGGANAGQMDVVAQQVACGIASPLRMTYTMHPPIYIDTDGTERLPTPSIETPMECNQYVHVVNVVPGARVRLIRTSLDQGTVELASCSEHDHVWFMVDSPMQTSDSFVAIQGLPVLNLSSKPFGPIRPEPVKPYPPSITSALCAGVSRIHVANLRPNSPIMFRRSDLPDQEWIGTASSTETDLYPQPPLVNGSTITVAQQFCGQWVGQSYQVDVTVVSTGTPQIPFTLFECAGAVRVSNVGQGEYVDVISQFWGGISIGRTTVPRGQAEVDVPLTHQLIDKDIIHASIEICNAVAQSNAKEVGKYAGNLDAPQFVGEITDTSTSIRIKGVVPGAKLEFQLTRLQSGAPVNSWLGLQWSGGDSVSFPVAGLQAEDIISVRQVLCDTVSPFSQAKVLLDTDKDGLSDELETKLLERFRPYFRFSRNKGHGENFRPTDIASYTQQCTLYDENDHVVVLGKLTSDPFGTAGTGGADMTANGGVKQFHLQPPNAIYHGADWTEIRSRKNLGLYGHVVPYTESSTQGTYRKYSKYSEALSRYLRSQHKSDDVICSTGRPIKANKRYYKVEYWQFFAYNSTDIPVIGLSMDFGDHEGDWTSLQLLVDPDDLSIVTVFHYAHGIEFRFDVSCASNISYLENNQVQQLVGPNEPPCDLDLARIDFHYAIWWSSFQWNWDKVEMAQNNRLRLYRDEATNLYTHPVVYIENGTHEFFPTECWTVVGAPTHNGDEDSPFLTATPPNLGEVEHPASEYPAAVFLLHYNGYWGKSAEYNSPPPGPSLHNEWTWPVDSQIRAGLVKLED